MMLEPWESERTPNNFGSCCVSGSYSRATESENEAGLYHAFWHYERIRKSQDIKAAFLVRYPDAAEANFATKTRTLPLCSHFMASIPMVTTGTAWKFITMEGLDVVIDLDEYSIENSGKIVGILLDMLTQND